jgi:hypothetical protein
MLRFQRKNAISSAVCVAAITPSSSTRLNRHNGNMFNLLHDFFVRCQRTAFSYAEWRRKLPLTAWRKKIPIT